MRGKDSTGEGEWGVWDNGVAGGSGGGCGDVICGCSANET